MQQWLARAALFLSLSLPALCFAQDPVPHVDPAIRPEKGTSDTTPPDPTIVGSRQNDPLSDDPGAATYDPTQPPRDPDFAYEIPDPVTLPFIDRAHVGVWNAVWKSAMHIDGWFGGGNDAAIYQRTSGSISPALLWDKFDGLQPRLRFDVDVPLPHVNSRLHAFVGRVNREEFVTERTPASGAIAHQYGPVEEDETLFGIRYRSPKQGGNFEANAGVRFRSPLDPFVKGSYRFMRGSSDRILYGFRETAFWQNSEKFGFTSRIDIEKILSDTWLLRWTGSGTISQETEGVRGYTSLTVMRGMPNRRAIAAQIFTTGEFDAQVPTENYGVKMAYRRSVARDWLILETRVSCTFPREELTEKRITNWGVGVGFEMYFGTDDFSARPVTF
jgi:hypothetical protein